MFLLITYTFIIFIKELRMNIPISRRLVGGLLARKQNQYFYETESIRLFVS